MLEVEGTRLQVSLFLLYHNQQNQVISTQCFHILSPERKTGKSSCVGRDFCVSFICGYSFQLLMFSNLSSLVKCGFSLNSVGCGSWSSLNSALRPVLDKKEGFVTFHLTSLGILLTSVCLPASQTNKMTRKNIFVLSKKYTYHSLHSFKDDIVSSILEF